MSRRRAWAAPAGSTVGVSGRGRGECDCAGPPPSFTLPPPPRPPPSPEQPYHAPGDCEAPLTCPSILGAREDQRPGGTRAPLAVVVVSAATLVVLVVVAAVIVCRLRGRGRAPKGCTELSGAIIYDDLPSAPSIVPARARTRFKPVPVDGEMVGMTMGVHLYTPEPRSNAPSEHLYQSISSGSETCSYSTSEAAAHDGRALLRGARHPRACTRRHSQTRTARRSPWPPWGYWTPATPTPPPPPPPMCATIAPPRRPSPAPPAQTTRACTTWAAPGAGAPTPPSSAVCPPCPPVPTGSAPTSPWSAATTGGRGGAPRTAATTCTTATPQKRSPSTRTSPSDARTPAPLRTPPPPTASRVWLHPAPRAPLRPRGDASSSDVSACVSVCMCVCAYETRVL
ncbi:uncharacterized protein LOC135091245 [Scylla paramamosain]|uniref:uncharacterized protein LOC135091245 n=1 Tax=Scylla paramamosain TaxID=85552 RepID=UPI0030832531